MTSLLIFGYEIEQATGKVQLEAASGIINAYVFEATEFYSFGIKRKKFSVCAYDFFVYHCLTDFDGMLGLDFFEGVKLCIDMKQNEITAHLK